MKKFTLCLLVMMPVMLQAQQPDDSQKSVLQAALIAYNISTLQTGSVYNEGEPVYDSGHRLLYLKVSAIGIPYETNTLTKGTINKNYYDNPVTVTPEDNASKQISSARITLKGCESVDFNVRLADDLAKSVHVKKIGMLTLEWTGGKITRLNGVFRKTSDNGNEFEKRDYVVTYADGMISSIEEYFVTGTGTDPKDVQEKTRVKQRAKAVISNADHSQIEIKVTDVGKKLAPAVDLSFNYTFKDNKETRQEFNNIKKKEISFMELYRDEKSRVIKLMQTKSGTGNKFITMEELEYNDKGLVTKLTVTDTIDDKFSSRNVSDIEYAPGTNADDPCSYKANVTLQTDFDANGVAKKEMKGTEFRVKMLDGSWAPWQAKAGAVKK
jgi:hypothetical protein